MPVPWLDRDPHTTFPPASSALREPDGLLAAGGDLSPARLLNAYRNGIFPWFSEGQPILWWCPDPRWVFRTDALHLPRRFIRTLRHSTWTVRADTAFAEVIAACAHSPRDGQRGTWITAAMQTAYCELHRLGHAHSIEVFDGPQLVGGLYGVAIGRMFFGESMFSSRSGGSKCALAALARQLGQWGWPLIDAQLDNPHLSRLGAESWPRDSFLSSVAELTAIPEPAQSWSGRFGSIAVGELAGAG
jgi:leucyl/phenylalanyl-tRNA--protein transferase